jgi:hypothetical protein
VLVKFPVVPVQKFQLIPYQRSQAVQIIVLLKSSPEVIRVLIVLYAAASYPAQVSPVRYLIAERTFATLSYTQAVIVGPVEKYPTSLASPQAT